MKKNKESASKNFLEEVLEANGMILNSLSTERNIIVNGKLCPLIKNPHNDCYCVNIDSTKVMPILYYCGGNFESCEIYRRLR